MKHYEKPLMVEYHEGYEDVFIWRGLPGGFSNRDLYFFVGLNLVVMIYQFIEGARAYTNYIGTFFVLLLLSGFYKGFKVGIDSIGYTKYETPLITRLADGFFIWGDDPPREVDPKMHVAIRLSTSNNPGVVYLYDENERFITFIAHEDHYLQEFAKLFCKRYDLKLKENVEH